MEQEKSQNTSLPTHTIMRWTGTERGDNLAIKSGNMMYTVDREGNLYGQRFQYSPHDVVSVDRGVISISVNGITDLKIGNTYTIASSEILLGKLLESNLQGYKFLCFKPDGCVTFTDMGYDEVIVHLQAGNIRVVETQ